MSDATQNQHRLPRRHFLQLGIGGFLTAGLRRRAQGAIASSKPARQCILIWMDGGPSHLDTFDPKPDAPVEIRGPLKTIRTRVPGIRFSEALPRLAAIADKLCIIRSLTHEHDQHYTASRRMLTGALPSLTTPRTDRPAYVSLPHPTRFDDRHQLASVSPPPSTANEPPTVRDMYGPSEIGRHMLRCRQLIEAGVPAVKYHCSGWDHHANIFKTLADRQLPAFDHALAGLITDLTQRGLLDSTLVIAMGEFGRSPIINKAGGRDHWPMASSVLLAGGGLPGGSVIGETDRKGYRPIDRPLSPEALAATIHAAMSIDHRLA